MIPATNNHETRVRHPTCSIMPYKFSATCYCFDAGIKGGEAAFGQEARY